MLYIILRTLHSLVFCVIGYVHSIGNILLSATQEKLEEVITRYASSKPKPLNTQFPARLGKNEAILKHKSQKSMDNVRLFPIGRLLFAKQLYT